MSTTDGVWWDKSVPSNPLIVEHDGHRAYHCEKVSPGCRNCWADGMNRGLHKGRPYNSASWSLTDSVHRCDPMIVTLNERVLTSWRHARKGKLAFACDMTDLFGEWWPDEMRDQVFAAMADSRHTFLVLTKRPDLALPYMWGDERNTARLMAKRRIGGESIFDADVYWPPPNVWLGVSVESPKYLWRIDKLMECEVVHWFVNFEPALGYINWADELLRLERLYGFLPEWFLAGCESGPHRRPTPFGSIEALVAACNEFYVACWVKQIDLAGRVSHDMAEWPEELRVRQWPEGMTT